MGLISYPRSGSGDIRLKIAFSLPTSFVGLLMGHACMDGARKANTILRYSTYCATKSTHHHSKTASC